MDNDAQFCGDVAFPVKSKTRFKHRNSKRKNGFISSLPSLSMSNLRKPSEMSRNYRSEKRIRINVGGKTFECYASTLQRFPHSKLAVMTHNDVTFDSQNDEYFFDRNPRMFDCILDCYRTGELHFPHCFCGPVIRSELQFWNLRETLIAPCCWKSYKFYEEEEKALEMLEKTFATTSPKIYANSPRSYEPNTLRFEWTKRRRQVLSFLEDPHSSRAAKVRFLRLVNPKWVFFRRGP